MEYQQHLQEPSVHLLQQFGECAGNASVPKQGDIRSAPAVSAAAESSGLTKGIINSSPDLPWKIALTIDDLSSTDDGEDSIQCIDNSENDRTYVRDLAPVAANTTLMVRNVPALYTQELLIQEWPQDGSWDFLYLPRSNSGAGRFNLTYAFINFVSEAYAVEFKARWHKKRLACFSSKKALNMSFAEVQGLEANLDQLQRKRVRMQSQPVVALSQ